ncbi:acyl-CoA thioesterase [Billgrantia aerodenitrificans]|uniref:Thioesterase n=1 Tax=Billgrantia aerodenitrificans TaxID=2733483 RepID=A0ABS9AR61_9GAMM|nr:thioesterase family protein [Halomonas aerodenitrificans]MCE8024126.1 thioesterase [Halomonas aerodenitrificans]
MTPCDFFPTMETVVGDTPLIIRRVVRWGDCDPAGIVYTPRFLDYTISAHEAFISLMLGGPLHSTKASLGVSFPVRGVELDFRSPLPVDTPFDMEVRVGEIRSRTFDLHVTARRVAAVPGPVAFLARVSPVTVDGASWTAVPLPDALRVRIAAYADAHPLHAEKSL